MDYGLAVPPFPVREAAEHGPLAVLAVGLALRLLVPLGIVEVHAIAPDGIRDALRLLTGSMQHVALIPRTTHGDSHHELAPRLQENP